MQVVTNGKGPVGRDTGSTPLPTQDPLFALSPFETFPI